MIITFYNRKIDFQNLLYPPLRIEQKRIETMRIVYKFRSSRLEELYKNHFSENVGKNFEKHSWLRLFQ